MSDLSKVFLSFVQKFFRDWILSFECIMEIVLQRSLNISVNCAAATDSIKFSFKESNFCCGQSYKHFTLINYDSEVVPDWEIPHITTLES